jgi:hypothetical protein
MSLEIIAQCLCLHADLFVHQLLLLGQVNRSFRILAAERLDMLRILFKSGKLEIPRVNISYYAYKKLPLEQKKLSRSLVCRIYLITKEECQCLPHGIFAIVNTRVKKTSQIYDSFIF